MLVDTLFWRRNLRIPEKTIDVLELLLYHRYNMLDDIDLNDDECQFLLSWEEVYKKGALTYWVLLLLSKNQYDAGQLYTELRESDMSLNEHSLYRMLRRLYDVGIIDTVGKSGRNKYYQTSEKGARILSVFMRRNITLYIPKIGEDL